MKKILVVAMVLLLAFNLMACGGGDKKPDYDELGIEEIIKDIAYRQKFEVEDIKNNGGNYKAILKKEILSSKTAKKEMLIKTKDILKNIADKDMEFINIEWQVELTDKLGNKEYGPVIRIDITKETLDKINWDNFDYNNLPEVADDYWQHQAIEG